MSGAATQTAEPVAYMLPDVNLFASGQYRGKEWPPIVMRMIAANARRLGPAGAKLLVPPSVLGHEEDEDQDWLNRTDLPAAGWVDPDSVRVVPDPDHDGELILRGNVVNIPPKVKREKLDTGEYKYGSSEIYEDFLDDFGRSYGKALRRFAFLGGEVPQVKRLGPLPAPVPQTELVKFSEHGKRVFIRERIERHGETTHIFAETTVMDPTQMKAALQAAMPGISEATLNALQPDQLADLVKNIPQPAAGAAAAAPSGQMADMDRDELIQALVGLGQDPTQLAAMGDDDLQNLYDQLAGTGSGVGQTAADAQGASAMAGEPSREDMTADLVGQGQDHDQLNQMSDDDLKKLYAQVAGGAGGAAAATGGGATGGSTSMSDRNRQTQQRVDVHAEGQRILAKAKRLESAVETELRRLTRANQQTKQRDAEQFCDRLVSEGRATPAQVKAAFLPALVALDNTRALHKFSDNGRTRYLTAYDLKKEQLAKLAPIIRFGERFPGGEGDAKDRKEGEVRKVEKFCEMFGDKLRVSGSDPKKMIETAKKMAESKPDFTAADLIGRDAAALVN